MLHWLPRSSTFYTRGSVHIRVTYIVQGETYKVDRAKRKHCMRSERAVAITLVVRRVSRQRACAQPCLQAGYCLSDVCVRLALSTLFVSPCTSIQYVCLPYVCMYTPPSIKCREFKQPVQHFLLFKPF
jgi:hypothetical protein